MPQSSQPRVFLSYSHNDGAELAQRLHVDLAKSFDTWLDAQRLTAGDIWSRAVEGGIDRANVVVALLSAGSYISDICRAEQQRALEKGKCVIPIRVQSDCDIPLYLQTRQWLDFSNPDLYPELLPRLLQSIHKQSGVAVSAESLVRYNNAPALPENFVNRPELLEALRNRLFTEGANRNIALTAMHGMGGIGKTVLAQALCHDEVVQQAFPDGIFWFAIGRESQLDFPARMKSVPGLDRLFGPYDGEAACVSQYRDVLRKKAALVVLDDLWHTSDVEPFLAQSPCSRLLITTRDTSIGAWFGAREFTANLLTEPESRQVLANWCGRAAAELPPQARDMIKECGRLPLALAMIGAQLRGKSLVLWNSVLNHLRMADEPPIDTPFYAPQSTLFRAIQVSVDALNDTARQRYLALAVLLDDMAAAPQVQQCIWGVGETEAAETAAQFVGLSLAQWDQPEGSIRLHDLQLDYVRHRTGESLPALHSQLVQNYKQRCLGGWHKGPNDGHFFENLAYHLAAAGQFTEAKDVLTNRDFIRAKFSNRISFVADLRVATQVNCIDDTVTAMVAVCEGEGPDGHWGQLRAALSQQFGHYTEWPGIVRNRVANSRNFGALLFVATTLGMEGMRTEAIRIFRRIRKLKFSSEEYCKASIRLSVIYEETGKTGHALRILRKLVKPPGAIEQFGDDYWWAQYQIGKNLLSKGRFNRAKEILENVRCEAREKARKTAALHQLGVIDLESGLLEKAEQTFKQCLAEREDVPTNHRRAFEYRRLGDVYALTGRISESEKAIEQALDISIGCGNWRYVSEIDEDRDLRSRVVQYLKRANKEDIVALQQLSGQLTVGRLQLRQAFARLSSEQDGFLEVVDEHTGRPTGPVARWETVHGRGLWHASIAVLVADRTKSIALQRRVESDSFGKWDISVAGHLDVGETDIQAAIRETREELGLDIDSAMLVRVGKPYQYWKVGSPGVTSDEHESANGYVYRKNNDNRERISLFVLGVTDEMKKKIKLRSESGSPFIDWTTPTVAYERANDIPERCASSLKQFLTSKRNLHRIVPLLRKIHVG